MAMPACLLTCCRQRRRAAPLAAVGLLASCLMAAGCTAGFNGHGVAAVSEPPAEGARAEARPAAAELPVSESPTPEGESPMSPVDAQPAGRILHADGRDFQKKVLQAKSTVLVDFYADWCGPCKMLAPLLEQLARETPGAVIVKVNVDESPELAAHYGVSAVPTLIAFSNGRPAARHVGLASLEQLRRMLQ